MELSFQLLLVQIQYAGRHKQKLFPFAQDGFRDLTSTTMLLKIVTTSKEETTRPETNRWCSVVAARAKVSPKLARGDMVQLHGATAPRFAAPLHSCGDFGLVGSAELIALLRVKFIREKCYLDSQDVREVDAILVDPTNVHTGRELQKNESIARS